MIMVKMSACPAEDREIMLIAQMQSSAGYAAVGFPVCESIVMCGRISHSVVVALLSVNFKA